MSTLRYIVTLGEGQGHRTGKTMHSPLMDYLHSKRNGQCLKNVLQQSNGYYKNCVTLHAGQGQY